MIRKWLKILLVLTVAIIALIIIGFQISKSRTFQFFGEIVPRVNTQQKFVALTFDDGPIPGATAEVLSVLNEGGVKATFFVSALNWSRTWNQGGSLLPQGTNWAIIPSRIRGWC